MKFLVAYKKGNKNLLKIEMDDGTEKWATTTEAVMNYAQQNFTAKEEAKFEMTKKNGQYHVTKILKAGAQASSSTTTEPTYKCEDCGVELKDGKYKKCYMCNKKNPTPSPDPKSTSTTKTYSSYQKSPEDKEQIKRLSVLSSASNAVATAMQGQVGDVDALADMILAVYEKLYRKVSE